MRIGNRAKEPYATETKVIIGLHKARSEAANAEAENRQTDNN